MSEKKYGPLWQLEQNLKTHRTNAQTWRNEAQITLRRAEEAEKEAEEYEQAIALLKRSETFGG